MGISKTDEFSSWQNNVAEIAKAMGHPARIAIVDYLLRNDECIGRDIVEEIPLSQPSISRHLKELKKANLITAKIQGNAICYKINDKGFGPLMKYILEIIAINQKRLL